MPTKNEIHARKFSVNDLTVKQFIEILQSLPTEQQDFILTCCGCSFFWVHLFLDENAVTIDTESCLRDEEY